MKDPLVRTAEGVGAAVAAATALHLLVYPKLADWGATPAEATARLPGDDLVTGPAGSTTRAVTIEASVDEVWAWLVQIGTDRGGWYTYDALERAAGVDVHNTDEIRAEWQRLDVGDVVRLAPEGWLGTPGLAMPVALLVPGQSIVLRQEPPASPWDGVWSFHVLPLGVDRCRLIARSRTARPTGGARVAQLVASVFMDPVTFLMERGMLLGIKARAERSRSPVSG